MDSCSAGSQLAAVLETLRFAWHVQNTQIPTECVWYHLWVFGSPDVDDLEQVKELLETMFNVLRRWVLEFCTSVALFLLVEKAFVFAT